MRQLGDMSEALTVFNFGNNVVKITINLAELLP
jgi:hypothetical protein